MMEQTKVIKRSDVLKSDAVAKDQGHHHKLWWINIEETSSGAFQLISYAQLFVVDRDGYATAQTLRKYPLETYNALHHAEKTLKVRMEKKITGKSNYSFFQKREGGQINISEEAIIKFLRTYSNIAS